MERISATDIGKIVKKKTVEPIPESAPVTTEPSPEPVREPSEPAKQPERVPA